MKTFFKSLMGLTLVVSAGCNQGEPGGAVTDNAASPSSHAANAPLHDSTRSTDMDTVNNGTVDNNTTVDHSASKPLIGEKDGTFTLDMPNLSTDITQGETQNVTISINRGDNFDQDVALQLTNLPKGVTITPEKPVLKAGEEEVVLAVAAAPDAALGDFTVNVSGQPAAGGATATNEFGITIEEK